MERLELHGWKILYDRAATQAAYAKVPIGGADSCGCDPCRNWVQSRDRLLPPELRALLDQLGIAPDRDAEVYHCARLESGLHSYGGWYHFVGQVLEGDRKDSPHIAFGAFSVFFHSKPALLPEAFTGYPVVQL